MPTPTDLPEWLYDTNIYQYQKLKSGRGITRKSIESARDEFLNRLSGEIDALNAKLVTGQVTIQDWVTQMRANIRQAYISEYVFARGGINMMSQEDWGRIGGILREQYSYLDNFAREIADGKLTPAQIQMRARMYIQSATEAFERGKAAARGLSLPAYPGDGKTQCGVNCKCNWSIREDEFRYYCYWQLNPAEHCSDCIINSQRWNPLILPKVRRG